MKVTLAYPLDEGEPDETVEVSDERGRTLIRDGFARLPSADDLTKAEAVEQARALRLDTSGTKAEVLERLAAAGAVSPSSTTAGAPADEGMTTDGR